VARDRSLPHPAPRAPARAAGADARARAAAAGPQPAPDLSFVKPVTQTPTEAVDYAALTTLYGALLGATAVTARGRGPIPRDEVPVLAAATFALSKLIVHEKVESWIRQPFVEEQAGRRRPKGRRLRYAVGELLTCTRCTGAWTALGLVALRLHAPATGRTVATVLAASAGSDMLHASFQWLCAGANTQDRPAAPRPVPLSRSAA
jgi:Protein of unknown function (DUF1360)